MSEEILTDEGLVEACRLGDLSAWEILVKRYEQPLRYSILPLSWIKDASFIDEIIQLTFITIFKGIKEGKPTRRLPVRQGQAGLIRARVHLIDGLMGYVRRFVWRKIVTIAVSPSLFPKGIPRNFLMTWSPADPNPPLTRRSLTGDANN